MPEQESPEARQELIESSVRDLEQLARRLGFVSNPEMDAIMSEINQENFYELLHRWRSLAEVMGKETLPRDSWFRFQIGLLVSEAAIQLKAGQMDEFVISMDDVREYALSVGLPDSGKIESEAAQILSRFKQ
jgi:hypothetical protein